MITRNNIADVLKSVVLSEMPSDLVKNLQSLSDISDGFKDFTIIDEEPDLKEFLVLTIRDLNDYFEKKNQLPSDNNTKNDEPVIKQKKTKSKSGKSEKKRKPAKDKNSKAIKEDLSEKVERILPEVSIIKRYVGLNGKKVSSRKILSLLSTLQKMIRIRVINKDSNYSNEILHIQKELLKIWNKHKNNSSMFLVEFDESDKDIIIAMKNISVSEKQLQSISFIKRFISIQGKSSDGQFKNIKEKASKLLKDVNKYIDNPIPNDKYFIIVKEISIKLFEYTNGMTNVIEVLSEQSLNGLSGLGLIKYVHNPKIGDLVRTWDGRIGRVTRITGPSLNIDSAPSDHYYNKDTVQVIREPEKKKCPNCQ